MIKSAKPTDKVRYVTDSAKLETPLEFGKNTDSTTVLIVDDNPTSLKHMVRAVDNGERNIIAVSEAGSAIDIITDPDIRVDILITDFHLKKNDEVTFLGDELLDIAKKANPKTKTIFVTGDPSDAKINNADHGVLKGRVETTTLADDKVIRGLVNRYDTKRQKI